MKDKLLREQDFAYGYKLLTYPGYLRLIRDDRTSVKTFHFPLLGETPNPPQKVLEDNAVEVAWAMHNDMKERGVRVQDLRGE